MTPLLALIDSYVEYLRDERQLAPATIYAYKSDALAFGRRFIQPVDTITRGDLRLYMRELKVQGKSRATIRRVFHGFGTLWSWLYVEHHAPDRITDGLMLPRRNKTLPRWLTEDELVTFLEPCYAEDQTLRLRAAWLFLARTGVRTSELINLQVRDLNRMEWLVTIRNTKGRVDRALPLEDVRLQRMLLELLAESDQGDYVFTGAFGDKWDRHRLWLSFRVHIRKSGLKDRTITPRALRHTLGTHMALHGVPVHVIKEWLGHKSISTTMIYLHAAPMDLRSAIRKLIN